MPATNNTWDVSPKTRWPPESLLLLIISSTASTTDGVKLVIPRSSRASMIDGVKLRSNRLVGTALGIFDGIELGG